MPFCMTMAVIVRCSCSLSHSIIKSGQSPPSDPLSVRPYLSGKLGSCYLSKSTEKLVVSSSLKDTHKGAFDLVRHVLPSSNCQWNPDILGTMCVGNALILAVPFKALAETCEVDNVNAMSNMPVLLAVALIGATVGGLVARQRKQELAKLNEQLRQINAALRRQAKIESYAPSLSYAPTGARIAEEEIIVDSGKQELITRLRAGKNFLRNQELDKAFLEFQSAFELAQKYNDPTKQKKAARGLGASLQRQGKYREAIKYHSMVLDISKRENEDSGSTEALGAIADCYTELGDLEKAGKFYDEYIARLEKD